ncbi:helix-turn-helix domain-containing protein [Treponema denticola]|uniref:helix-turn-helix domain-containing protein n=1 Tax=Treponema denticola TaxID=158 RepID=UPI0020A39508|nr:helix-turn-helix domain-containing protein [Treponema denticola]UTD07135.1 helix-turn-helix domain-containing protein [Treponema denticola]
MAVQFFSSDEIAERANVSRSAVLKWACNNDVGFLGKGVRKTYVFTEEDYERFLKRPKPGKRAKTVDNS